MRSPLPRRIDLRLSEEEFLTIQSTADTAGLSVSEYVRRIAIHTQQRSGDPVGALIVAAEVPTSLAGLRYRKVLSPQFTHQFIADPGLGEGDSYWSRDGARYYWSTRFDEAEIANMIVSLRGSGAAYANAMETFLHEIAIRWATATTRIMNQTAQNLKCYPTTSDNLTDNCCAWLHWVHDHPKTSSDRHREIMNEVGTAKEWDVRSALTWLLTQRNGYLIAEYPWFII